MQNIKQKTKWFFKSPAAKREFTDKELIRIKKETDICRKQDETPAMSALRKLVEKIEKEEREDYINGKHNCKETI